MPFSLVLNLFSQIKTFLYFIPHIYLILSHKKYDLIILNRQSN